MARRAAASFTAAALAALACLAPWGSAFVVVGPAARRCVVPARGGAATSRGRSTVAMSTTPISAAEVTGKLEAVWDRAVPHSIGQIIDQAQASLSAALRAGETRLRIDIRTPGLDEALEQTAIRDKALLLGVVAAFFPLFAGKKTKVCFESEGEAAMAAKAFASGGFLLPDSVTFAGLTPRAVEADDEIVFLVEPVNRSGSPVVLVVEQLVQAHPGKTFVVLNPDLEMKGTLGIRERDRRQGFLDTFKSAYMYLCLATLSRPALIPRELGAFHFQYEEGRYRLLRCLLPEDGPGSLNRFLKRAIYETVPGVTPTTANPPNFYTVAEWDRRPSMDELSSAMAGAEGVLEGLIRTVAESIDSVEEAREVLLETARTKAVDPEKVLQAIEFLEKASRKGGKKDDDEQKRQAEELQAKMAGEWRLIFTSGTKNTQSKMGRINYFPVKAGQTFSKKDDAYANRIFIGSYPIVQVLGTYSCPRGKRLDFVVQQIKLGPLGFGNNGTGFFTMFYVDSAIAVARGQGGGVALWFKVDDLAASP